MEEELKHAQSELQKLQVFFGTSNNPGAPQLFNVSNTTAVKIDSTSTQIKIGSSSTEVKLDSEKWALLEDNKSVVPETEYVDADFNFAL